MRNEICKFRDLQPKVLCLWRDWIAAERGLQSPFLHPEFAKAVDRAFGNVEVGIGYDQSEPIGVLPFQRTSKNSAGPVGGYLSDRQGVIAPVSSSVKPSNILAKTDIRSFRFHVLPESELHDQRCAALRRKVVYADVSGGFDQYQARKKNAGSNVVPKLAQKERKIAKEVGKLTLATGFTEERFEKLLCWRKLACQKRHIHDCLEAASAQKTLRYLSEVNDPEFRPHFSTLHAGNQIIAIHYGLIFKDRLNVWLLAFNPEFQRYSPGLLMLLQLIRNCENWGVSRLDFGSGELAFKNRFMTSEETVLEGVIDQSLVARTIHCFWLRARDWAKASRFHQSIQQVWYHSLSKVFG